MTVDELRAIVALAKAEGVRRLSVKGDDVELEMFVAPVVSAPVAESSPASQVSPEQQRQADLEMLFKSAGVPVPAQLKES